MCWLAKYYVTDSIFAPISESLPLPTITSITRTYEVRVYQRIRKHPAAIHTK